MAGRSPWTGHSLQAGAHQVIKKAEQWDQALFLTWRRIMETSEAEAVARY